MSRAEKPLPTLTLKIVYEDAALATPYGDDELLKVDVDDPAWEVGDVVSIKQDDLEPPQHRMERRGVPGAKFGGAEIFGRSSPLRGSGPAELRVGSFAIDLGALEETPLLVVSRRRQEWAKMERLFAPLIAEDLGLPETDRSHQSIADVVAAAGDRLPPAYAQLVAKASPEEDPEWERFEWYVLRQVDRAQIKKGGSIDLPTRRLLRGMQRTADKRPKNLVEVEGRRSRHLEFVGLLLLHLLFLIHKRGLRRNVTAVVNMPEGFFAVASGESRPLPFDEDHELSFNSDQAALAILRGSFEGTQVYDEDFEEEFSGASDGEFSATESAGEEGSDKGDGPPKGTHTQSPR